MLFGCPDVLRSAYRAIRKGAFGGKSRSDKPNIERVVGIIREMRRDYLSCIDDHFWREARTLYRLPLVLPELRKTAEEHLQANTFLLGVLNRLCGVLPTDEHPIFCDGVMDEWSVRRIGLGIRRVGYLASTGDTEGTFAAPEIPSYAIRKLCWN